MAAVVPAVGEENVEEETEGQTGHFHQHHLTLISNIQVFTYSSSFKRIIIYFNLLTWISNSASNRPTTITPKEAQDSMHSGPRTIASDLRLTKGPVNLKAEEL